MLSGAPVDPPPFPVRTREAMRLAQMPPTWAAFMMVDRWASKGLFGPEKCKPRREATGRIDRMWSRTDVVRLAVVAELYRTIGHSHGAVGIRARLPQAMRLLEQEPEHGYLIVTPTGAARCEELELRGGAWVALDLAALSRRLFEEVGCSVL